MSDCACIYAGYDDECYATLKQKIVTARKTHKCGECHREISSGEQYEYYTGVLDGEIGTEKTCMDCLSLRNSGLFCNGFIFQEIWELFSEAFEDSGKVDYDALAKLTPVAQEMAFGIVERYWEGWDE